MKLSEKLLLKFATAKFIRILGKDSKRCDDFLKLEGKEQEEELKRILSEKEKIVFPFVEYIKELRVEIGLFVVGLLLVTLDYNLATNIIGYTTLYLSDFITTLIKDAKHEYEIWEMKRDTEARKTMTEEEKAANPLTVPFDMDSLQEKWAKEKAARPKLWALIEDNQLFLFLRRHFWYNLLDHPCNFQGEVKHRYQRAMRGWSDRDTWCFYSHLNDVIIGGIKHLKKTNQGIPMLAFTKTEQKQYNHSDEVMEKAEARWDKMLDKIVKTFETAEKIGEYYWFYQDSEEYSNEMANKRRKTQKQIKSELEDKDVGHVMTKKECKEYEDGWKLLMKCYHELWD